MIDRQRRGQGSRDRPLRDADIVAHLCYVAAEICNVGAEIDGRVVMGQMHLPDFERLAVVFTPAEGAFTDGYLPRAGAAIRFMYAQSDDSYAFRSEVMAVEGDGSRWLIKLPRTVVRSQRRLARRHRPMHDWKLEARNIDRLGETRMLELVDLSSGGMGVLFDPGQVRLAVGQLFSGALRMPPDLVLPVRAEVKNVRRVPRQAWRRIAGCAFSGFGFVNYATLARVLEEMDRDRRERTFKD